MTYKIDKDVPMPDTTAKSEYPFADMQVGDSFFAAGKTANQLRNAAGHWRAKMGWKFHCRNVVENDIEGARIWRSE